MLGILPPKAASMSSGRSCPAPSADLFTADERRVLRSWFSNGSDPSIKRILARWRLGAPPPLSSALDVAVAAVLERVQLRHPRLGATVAPVPDAGCGMIFTADPRQPVRPSSIVPLSRHLFTLRWIDEQEPDLFWPSTYTATPLPGTDKIVLAVSDSGGNSLRVASDTAIGWASGAADFPESLGVVVRRHWSNLRDQTNLGRWLKVSQPGLLDEATLAGWADTVWPWAP